MYEPENLDEALAECSHSTDDKRSNLFALLKKFEHLFDGSFSKWHGEPYDIELEEGVKPSLIILDIMMPLMSGWQIHRKLGENPDWKGIPIVFLTGRSTETAIEMCNRYGVQHIKKPFDIKDLKQRIENILFERQKYSKEMHKCHV